MSVTLDWVVFLTQRIIFQHNVPIVLDVDLNLIPPMSLKYGTNKKYYKYMISISFLAFYSEKEASLNPMSSEHLQMYSLPEAGFDIMRIHHS